MIFDAVTTDHFAYIRRIVKQTGYRSCQLSAGSLYCLAQQYHTQVCCTGSFLFVAQRRPQEGVCYFMPIGTGDLAQALAALKDYHSRHHDTPFALWGIADDMVQPLRNAVGGGIELIPDRDWAEYIHEAQRLYAMSGRRFQPKRNAANQFRRNFPHFVYEPITAENTEEVWRFQQEHPQLDGKLDHTIRRGLDIFEQGEFIGGVIRIDGKIRGYTFGCPINDTDFDILFENADKQYNGIFQALEQELIARQLGGFEYINREEDLGIEGIRFAKTGLHPDILLMKYKAVYL